TLGDTDNDGDFDELYSYGARSFSIRDIQGNLVFDSGDELEQITAAIYPDDFNSSDEENNSFDDRSDDKGPEPEGVVIGRVLLKPYLFLGLERIGGIMVYDVSNPSSPSFVQYINTRDFSGDPLNDTAGDLSPEGLKFIPAWESPNHKPLLVASYEISGSTRVFEINLTFGKEDGEVAENAAGLTPGAFSLEQNYPNPFNPTTEIRFQLPQAGNVTLTVYNTLGQEIRTLANGYYESGAHSVQWDGRDQAGNPAASGVYFYKIVTDQHVALKKMNLLK
ncbi:MAG: T9SS type A sorting domain-containing protein, partial [Calditrichaeota bacterium]|nr:T9SS type A sorting domain-containing protein [Calditrichota bacterium]